MILHHQDPNDTFGPSDPNAAFRSQFTWKKIILNSLLITGAVWLNKLGAIGNAIFIMIMIVMSLRSSEGALKALSLTLLATMSNQAYVSLSIIFAVGRIVVIFVVAARFLIDLQSSRQGVLSKVYIIFLFLFCATSALGSIINGFYVTVSLLKLLLFSAGSFAVLIGAEVVRIRASDMTAWCYSLILYSVGAGVIGYATGIGYGQESRAGIEGVFFKGAFSHSQALGIIGAMMLVYLGTLWFFSPYRFRWLTCIVAGVLLFQLYLTGSRTGMGTAVLGMAATIGLALVTPATAIRRVRFRMSKIQLIVIGISGLIGVIFLNFFSGNVLGDIIGGFLGKHGATKAYGLSLETIFATRLPLIEYAINNFNSSPMTGIGFGTAYDDRFIMGATWYTAPTEKGFLPTAVLEETGLIGVFFFLGFIVSWFVYLIRERNISGFGMMVTFLLANLGEMVFFSFGGAGGLCWFMVAAGLALSDRCLTGPNINRPSGMQ